MAKKIVVGGMGISGFGRRANKGRREYSARGDSTKDLISDGRSSVFDLEISESIHGGDPVEDLLRGGSHVFSIEMAVF